MPNELRSQNWHAYRLLLPYIFQVLLYSELMQTSFAVHYISKSFAEPFFRVHPGFVCA